MNTNQISIKEKWKAGISLELSFWENWMITKGAEWPEDFKRRTNPNSRLTGILSKYINTSISKNKILDVGAGPLTTINKKHESTELEIEATDALADEYNELLKKHGITPIIKTQKQEGEELSKKYKPNTFDISYSRNAIDPAYNPIKIIKEMINVTKKEGYIIIEVFLREGSNANWGGLHSWDFYFENEKIFINGQNKKQVNITELVKNMAKLKSVSTSGKTIEMVFQKI